MNSANKVAINTGILYMRMFLTMGLSLYTTRIVLLALGEIDYGIYNLVAGVVAMLAFLNAAMTVSTQRFLSFYQGKDDFNKQKEIFFNSLVLHLLIGLALLIFIEILGLFLFKDFLNIPTSRILSAKFVYHTMSLSVFLTVIAVPFNGLLIAHENMYWQAAVSIVETILKLVTAIVIFNIAFGDKLIVYAIGACIISFISLLLSGLYCFRKYKESHISYTSKIDVKMFKELSAFAGWNIFGSICGLGRTQGLAIMLNMFFGAAINASYALANQVSAQLSFFSATLLRAINPQIMKSEGIGDRSRMLKISMIASKFCFFLLAIIAIPIIFEMRTVLIIWLKILPPYAVEFCTLILLSILANQLTIGLQSGFQATGKIKVYQSLVGSLLILNVPLAYFLLKINLPPTSVIVSFIIIELVACILRVVLLKNIAGLSIKDFLNRVIFKEIIPIISIVMTCVLVTYYINVHYRFVLTFLISGIVSIVSIYAFGLCSDEKKMLLNVVNSLKVKLKLI